MKCKYYGDAWGNCKLNDGICQHEGDWHKCKKLSPVGIALMNQKELEKVAKNASIQELDITPKLSYDYLKGFYDGVKAVTSK